MGSAKNVRTPTDLSQKVPKMFGQKKKCRFSAGLLYVRFGHTAVCSVRINSAPKKWGMVSTTARKVTVTHLHLDFYYRMLRAVMRRDRRIMFAHRAL